MRMKASIFLAFLLALVAALGCGPTLPSETPTVPVPTATDTLVPAAPTATPTEGPTNTPHPTATPTEVPCTPDSAHVADLDLPDGTLVSPGETVTKTWRIENDGDCTWTPEYTWNQIETAGNKFLGVPLSIPLAGTVPPGGTIDISVQIRLDPTATLGSVYTARFQMRSPGGDLFGAHPFSRIYAINGTGVCPLATGSLEAFINQADRFCFLNPGDHNAYIGIPGDTMVVAPAPPGPGEHVVPYVSIGNRGSTAGQTIQQWANSMMLAALGGGPLPPTSNTTVGAKSAIQTDGLPGILGNRTVYVINNNIGFEITVYPVDAGFPAETADALDLWNTIRTSFAFYAP